MSDFVPNNRNLLEILIFFFHSKKMAAKAHGELQKVYGDAALSENLPGNAQMESPTPPAVFTRYCAVRLLVVPGT